MTKIWSRCIQYSKYGPPKEVLTLGKIQVDTNLSSNQVLVKWLASPINPLDINKIEGHYPVPPDFPIIGGSEVIGEVERVGSDVKSLKPGDAVVSLGMTQTCWSEYAVIDETLLLKIDKRIDLVSAATLLINPPTAYVMLKEYVDLNPGDFIIQNASNSGVGRSVIQLAKAFGLKSINLVRNRPNIQDLKNELHQLGADYVFTEEEFRANSRTFLKSLDTPIRLALNGVGGKSCLAISNALGSGGTLVTYGGMGKQPHEISTSGFVFKNIKAEGIAITLWLNQESQENVQK
uniref:Enoyl-[acyl-carrier-protein] reductase, mitochondrial n=1 Tax=Acrobeloides nanus TaxID=290746 RepID=A0A914EKC1_9BILA